MGWVMDFEIERKFLVKGDAWRGLAAVFADRICETRRRRICYDQSGAVDGRSLQDAGVVSENAG